MSVDDWDEERIDRIGPNGNTGLHYKKLYVLLDYEGNPVRFFDYPAEGTVEVVEEKYTIDWNNFEEGLF